MLYLPQPLRRIMIVACGIVLVPACAVSLLWWQWHRNHPYGWEHCCDKQIGLALMVYADEHGGHYPTGGATPEGSLSLLYPKYADAAILRGKTYPEEPAKRLLEAGKPLTPETCGWHYVDGLTMPKTGMSNIAIFWDKIGLDHNSGILPEGGHSVTFMDGHGKVVKESDWERFLADQEKAWAAIRRNEEPPVPWLPSDLF